MKTNHVWLKVSKEFKRQSRRNKKTGCYIWCGGTNSRGYGQYSRAFTMFGIIDSTYSVYRIAYIAYTGKSIPKKHVIMHTCDTPACWNPRHLRLGTPKDNSQDMVKKDRQEKGANRYNAKLTDEKVRELKRLAPTMSQRALARKFGITQTTCRDILHKRKWKHVEGPEYTSVDPYLHRRRISDSDIGMIRALVKTGTSKNIIMTRYKLSLSYLNQLLRHERR